MTVQILLGIFTLLSGVELWIAASHQGMAVLLLAAALVAAHRLGRARRPTARLPSRGRPARRAGMSAIVTVYATFPSQEEARRIARILVEERLAACANILGALPLHLSLAGRDRGSGDEVAALFKTRADLADALIARLAELHSYERAGGGRLADRGGARFLPTMDRRGNRLHRPGERLICAPCRLW